jgi:hypothetical protein
VDLIFGIDLGGRDFANTAAGVIAGGLIAVAGQVVAHVLLSRQQSKQRRNEFKAAALAEIQDQLVHLSRAADDAWDHRRDVNWQTSRYDGVKVRIQALAARVNDDLLDRDIASLLLAMDLTIKEQPGNPATHEDLKKTAAYCVRKVGARTADDLRSLY